MRARRSWRLLFLAAWVFWNVPASARPLDDVVASGAMRIALYEDYYPFSYLANGQARGIEVEIAARIAAALKIKAEVVLVTSGETLDADLRLNLWRGDLAGSQLADLMLHVPHDKPVELRNELVFLSAPYFEHRVAVAFRKSVIESFDNLAAIEDRPVAVEVDTVGDFLLLMAEGGRYRPNLRHYRTFDDAITGFLAGEAPILVGTRALIEGALHRAGDAASDVALREVPIPGFVRSRWPIGGAVKTDSRDLAYAVDDILSGLRESGELAAIFASYGVTYLPAEGY